MQIRSRNFKRFNADDFILQLQESDIFKRPVESLDSFVEQIKKMWIRFWMILLHLERQPNANLQNLNVGYLMQ